MEREARDDFPLRRRLEMMNTLGSGEPMPADVQRVKQYGPSSQPRTQTPPPESDQAKIEDPGNLLSRRDLSGLVAEPGSPEAAALLLQNR